jgi:DNA repair exonuclease SbcCD ATPase subunit
MYFLSLEAENFLSIGQVSLTLNNRGLLVVVGENLDDSSVVSNGSGKSSIIESIFWCLFGKTLRGVSLADKVINRTAKKNCRVKVALKVKSGLLEIERFRKHRVKLDDGSTRGNSILVSLNGISVEATDPRTTQRVIDKLLGMDSDMFSRLVLVAQGFNQRFTEMNDRKLKEFIEGMTGSMLYAKAHGEAKARLDSVKETLASLGGFRQSLDISIKQQSEQIQEEEVAVAKAEEARKVRLSELQGQINDLQLQLANARELVETASKERDANIAQYDKQIADWDAHLKLLNADLKRIREEQQKIKQRLRESQSSRLSEIDREIAAIRDNHEVAEIASKDARNAATAARDEEVRNVAGERAKLDESLKEDKSPVEMECQALKVEIEAWEPLHPSADLHRALATAEGKIAALDSRIAQDLATAGTQCPTCGKAVTEEEAKARVAAYDPDTERDNIVKEIESCRISIASAEQEIATEETRRRKRGEEFEESKAKLNKAFEEYFAKLKEFDDNAAQIPSKHHPIITEIEAKIAELRTAKDAAILEKEKRRTEIRAENEAEAGALDFEHNQSTVKLTDNIATANTSLQEVQRIKSQYAGSIGLTIDGHEDNVRKMEGQVNVLEGEIVVLNMKDLQIVLTTLKDTMNDFQRQLKDNEAKVKEAEDAQYLYDYLVTAFGLGGIRSYMLDSIISFLNERLKVHCQDLFDGYVAVELSPVFEQKNKSVVDKISLIVTTDGGHYDASSGGERRKIDVVLFLAFRDLNHMLSPVKTNLEAFDEVLDSLDAEAASRVIQILIADESVETKILITHRVDIPIIGPHNILKAVKHNRVTTYNAA